MKLGLHIASTSWAGGSARMGALLTEIVETAEAVGFDMIDTADHVWLHPIVGGPEENHIEAYTALSFIAAQTQRVRLMTLATAASYRPAGLLAKMVTTLDVLSGGRAMLGIGAGDYPEEAAGLGLSFPSLRERFDILEETIQACLQMWDGEQGSGEAFHGHHVRMERALNLPQSLSRPHPPILIAGSGERRTLPLVARSRASSTCSAGFATRRGATTTRSRRPRRSGSTSVLTARKRRNCSASSAGCPRWASRLCSAG